MITVEKKIIYKYNDGGRSLYFKGKDVYDCVVRAAAIATDMDYKIVYDMIMKISGKTPRNGVDKNTTRKLMSCLGGKWVACMGIGTGCKVHLKKEELPHGKIICNLSGHVVAVIDGVIQDTSDPSRNGNRCVYG